ncbi:MAG: L,D-transpeptidase [Magnetococcales bacterium]|nr:L,D-transpeptidase [Magnetococcales bacterium]MBF0322834.1 L,D-transpeptidase [Magnetococcales bacterium]
MLSPDPAFETLALEEAKSTLRAAGWDAQATVLVVLGRYQRLYCLEQGGSIHRWPVSTGRAGFGNQIDSGRTPIGLHRICACIGEGEPLGAVFKGRVPTGEIAAETIIDGPDAITTRILWLDGLEEGYNRGPGVDTKDRYIYIHGTSHANLLGQPASAGCVRMKNEHILDLFWRVRKETLVLIEPG